MALGQRGAKGDVLAPGSGDCERSHMKRNTGGKIGCDLYVCPHSQG